MGGLRLSSLSNLASEEEEERSSLVQKTFAISKEIKRFILRLSILGFIPLQRPAASSAPRFWPRA